MFLFCLSISKLRLNDFALNCCDLFSPSIFKLRPNQLNEAAQRSCSPDVENPCIAVITQIRSVAAGLLGGDRVQSECNLLNLNNHRAVCLGCT
jgi:hypothetical protein